MEENPGLSAKDKQRSQARGVQVAIDNIDSMQWSHSYLYTSADVRASAPARPGLYRLRIDLGHIFYIGQSQNLQRRMLEHFLTREKNRRLRYCLDAYPCYFQFAELHEGSDLLQAERDEVLKYKPYANTADAPPVVGRWRK